MTSPQRGGVGGCPFLSFNHGGVPAGGVPSGHPAVPPALATGSTPTSTPQVPAHASHVHHPPDPQLVPTPVVSSIPQIQFLPDAVLIVAEDNSIIDCNRTASEVFGYTREELLRLSIHELVPPKYREMHYLKTAQVFDNMQPREMSKRKNVQACPKSGKCFEVSIHLSPAYLRDTVRTSEIDEAVGDEGATLVERTALRKIVTCVCRDMRQHNAMIRKHNEAEQRAASTESFLRLLNHEVRTGMHGVVNALATVKEEMVGFMREAGIGIDPAWLREDPMSVHGDDKTPPTDGLHSRAISAPAADSVRLSHIPRSLAPLTGGARSVPASTSDPFCPVFPTSSATHPSSHASASSSVGLSRPIYPEVLPPSKRTNIASLVVSETGEPSPFPTPFTSEDRSSPRSAVRSLLMLEAGVTGMDMLFRNMLDYRGLLDDSVVQQPIALDIRHFLDTLKFNHRARWLTKQQNVFVSVPANLPLVICDVAILTKLVECLFDNCIKHSGSGARILLECTDISDISSAGTHHSPMSTRSATSNHSFDGSEPKGESLRHHDAEQLEHLLCSPPPLGGRATPRDLVTAGIVRPSNSPNGVDECESPSALRSPLYQSSPIRGQFKHVVIQRADMTGVASGSPSPIAKVPDAKIPEVVQEAAKRAQQVRKEAAADVPASVTSLPTTLMATPSSATPIEMTAHPGSESAEMRVRSLRDLSEVPRINGGKAGPSTDASHGPQGSSTTVGPPTAAFPSFVSYLLAQPRIQVDGTNSTEKLSPPSQTMSDHSNASETPEPFSSWPSPSAVLTRRLAKLTTASPNPLVQTGPTIRRLQFVVCDTGAGIAPSVLAAIEEEILNVDASSTRATSGGVGLGLHIAKMCATKLRATLTLSSRQHFGPISPAGPQQAKFDGWKTAFSFIAAFQVVPHSAQLLAISGPPTTADPPISSDSPISVASNVSNISSTSTNADDPSAELLNFRSLSDPQRQRAITARLSSEEFAQRRANFRVLIVEDNAINIKVLQRTCTRNGFTNVQICLNGQQAIDKCQEIMQRAAADALASSAHPSDLADLTIPPNPAAALSSELDIPAAASPFDLILMDCEMPVKDGWNATRELRQLGCLSPIFALTANATQQGQTRCRESGMDLFLNKPLSAQNLLFAIAALPPFRLYPLEYCPHVLIPAAFSMPAISELTDEHHLAY